MPKRDTYYRLWLLLLVPLCLGLTALAKQNPQMVESLYATGFYAVYGGVIARLTGFLPFSVAEILLLGGLAYLLFRVAAIIIGLAKGKGGAGPMLKRLAADAAVVAAVLYLLFTLGGGLNYYRYLFTAYSGLQIQDSSQEELAALCEELVDTVNGLRAGLEEDEAGVMALPGDADPPLIARQAYQNASQRYPVLALGGLTTAKPVRISEVMSYGQIVGVFVPITIEANYNRHTLDYDIPSSICHELAHISGFMREDEANYISFWVCRQSENPYFRYSGGMLALSHALKALRDADHERYVAVRSLLSEAVRRDLAAHRAYWERYDTPAGELSQQVNDVYLQLNNQRDGVASYGRMVDLLLADYRQRHQQA